jgi:hypothetical protein
MVDLAALGSWFFEASKGRVALVAFAGGSLMAAVISAFVKHCISHPVISVRLDERNGCYGLVPLYRGGQKASDAKYFRLRIENTGFFSIKECSGYITKITKRVGAVHTVSEEEVLDLGWPHHPDIHTRDIPRGAFFYMDIATLHLLPAGGSKLGVRVPTNLLHFFDDKDTYKFEILIASENARPHRKLPVEFTFDPASTDLTFTAINRARYPWWKFWRWPTMMWPRLNDALMGRWKRS